MCVEATRTQQQITVINTHTLVSGCAQISNGEHHYVVWTLLPDAKRIKNSVGRIAEKAVWSSAFLLVCHSKYSAILSKIHSFFGPAPACIRYVSLLLFLSFFSHLKTMMEKSLFIKNPNWQLYLRSRNDYTKSIITSLEMWNWYKIPQRFVCDLF